MRLPEIRPGFVLLISLACFFLPQEMFWPFLLGSTAHELGHLAALSLCAVRVRRIRLSALGAIIETEPMAPGTEALCAMAGPAVNLFAFWSLRRVRPGAAVICLALGACNLLPLYPLDGGRILRSVLIQLLPLPAAKALCYAVEGLTLLALGAGTMVLCRRFGIVPAVLYALLVLNLARNRNFLLPSVAIPDIMRKTNA